jgi:hypothetical protein
MSVPSVDRLPNGQGRIWPNEYELFKKPGLKHDFYLTHGMAKPLFDPEWKLYYPQNF